MALTELLLTTRGVGVGMVERLQTLGIGARVLEGPALYPRAGDKVHVVVPEEDLARSRAELARWEAEAVGRVEKPVRAVRRALVFATLPALGTGLGLLALGSRVPEGCWIAAVPVWFASLFAWAFWQRRTARRAGKASKG